MSFNAQNPEHSNHSVSLNSEAKEFIPNNSATLPRLNLNPDDPQNKENQSRRNTGAVRKRYERRDQQQNDYREYDQQSSSRKFYSDSGNNGNYSRNDRNDPPERVRRDQHSRNGNYPEQGGPPRRYNNRNQNYNNQDRYNHANRNNWPDEQGPANSTNSLNNRNRNYNSDYSRYNKKPYQHLPAKSKKEKLEDAIKISQREQLTKEINHNNLECLICCEFIKYHEAIWNCGNCFHVLHLNCIQKWAKSSKVDDGWRCVACQDVSLKVPTIYYCFCGKMKNPSNNRVDTAHSCGETCGRTKLCEHPCSIQCHPGGCPKCQIFVQRSCGCGKTTKTFQCSQKGIFCCSEICDKFLNCGLHKCKLPCHEGECTECAEVVNNVCYCEKQSKEIVCSATNNLGKQYSCSKICDKKLSCGNHNCLLVCHEGDCKDCQLSLDLVKTCPCGKTPVVEGQRTNCLDEIPTCKASCNKPLKCGPLSAPHVCQTKCHTGNCICKKTTLIKCRCGRIEENTPCKKLSKDNDLRCKKKCTKFKKCGKHKCNVDCCIEIEHICQAACNRFLSCGKHRCDKKCHIANCSSCARVSFDELRCECGAAVVYPPVECGTPPPVCNKVCRRSHPCEHKVLHNCHSDEVCPPCVMLTTKFCFGKHEQRKTIPCNQQSFSCGMACDKPVSCGRHKCIKSCHEGECAKPNELCRQKCTKSRSECDHICAAPCHEGDCPEIPCKEQVEVQCECGNRKMMRPCQEVSNEYRRIFAARLTNQMLELQQGGDDMDLQNVYGKVAAKKNNKTLECNEECKVLERNRRLDIAFKVQNPNLASYPKFVPNYSEFLKSFYKRDSAFVNNVHEKLTTLVKLAKESKQPFRSFSFPSCNHDKRHVIHDLCEMFGVSSVAYDAEPNRNVVATADKTCWLPSLSLQEILAKQRKIVVPSNNPWGN